MTLSSFSIRASLTTNKKPHSVDAMGFSIRRNIWSTLIGLPQRCGFSLFRHQLARSTDRLHYDRFVLGGVADDDTEFAPFATVDKDFSNHLGSVQV
jgi:hypothetical protein